MSTLIVIDENAKQLKNLPNRMEDVEVYELAYLSKVIIRIANGELETVEHSNFKMNEFLSLCAVRFAKDYVNKNNLKI